MDTVHEENRQRELKKVGFLRRNHTEDISEDDELHQEQEQIIIPRKNRTSLTFEREYCFLHPPQLTVTDTEAQVSHSCDCNGTPSNGDSSALSSRRPSAIIAALRRPSQAVALSAAQAVMNQRRYLLGLFNDNSTQNLKKDEHKFDNIRMRFNRTIDRNGFTIILSALYAKLLVVLGIAFPITEVISPEVHPFYYQGFYLYLYVGSIIFITYEYVSFVKERAIQDIVEHFRDAEKGEVLNKINPTRPAQKYGSFFLRVGAIESGWTTRVKCKRKAIGWRLGGKSVFKLPLNLWICNRNIRCTNNSHSDNFSKIINKDLGSAFGIGSMVYSGLEFGKYFELKNTPDCHYTSVQAFTPALRMILTLLQVQFIFLNHKDVELTRHKIIGRFGLMHMIATNICEWFYVLIEETGHEILHLSEHHRINATNSLFRNSKYCPEGRVMGSLVNNASPFLFPCTIEYSLICAVILFEMWKHIQTEKIQKEYEHKKHKHKNETEFTSANTGYHFTIDCSNSHKGLFTGIMVIVLTIISLVMFFVLTEKENESGIRNSYAETEVNVVELILYVATSVSVIIVMYQLRNLKHEKKIGHGGMGLDNMLLAVAQTGMFIYSMFSIIGWYFTKKDAIPVGLVADIFSFIQTCLQTMFILDAWCRRCKSLSQAKSKPGRQLIIFLMVANMAMWSINTLEKNRAEFRPTHLEFFGDWAWTIITHISMPLAIFYRFHSTICLFEIWKSAYKIKSNFKNPLFPVM